MLKYVLRAVYCLFLGRLWRQSQLISSMSEAQGGSLIREQFPPNTTPARVRTSAVTVETELQSVVDLFINYICNLLHLFKLISWVKSTIYDGLNKQSNLMGKINPKCVLSYIYPAQIGLFLTQCFLKYAEFVYYCAVRH